MADSTRPNGQTHGRIGKLVQRVRVWLRRRMQKEEPNIYPFY